MKTSGTVIILGIIQAIILTLVLLYFLYVSR